MNAKRVIPTLTVAAACTVGAVPVASARAAEVQQASSGNWSGYVVASSAARSFKSVTGSWVQPTAKCSTDGEPTYSAFWVGLGGATGTQALEQDGTEVNCSAQGVASYYAWYELVPKAPVKTDLAVHPGDHMTATTTVNGHTVTETIVNHTTGHSFAKTLTMSDPDTSSAEWIAEAPSQCEGSVANCSTLSLSDFGTVKFTGASATDSTGHTGAISDRAWSADALTLTPDGTSSAAGATGIGYAGQGETTASAAAGASPSSLDSSGSAFSVSYRKASASSAASGTSGYGDGSGSGGGYGGGSAYGYGGGYGYGGYGSSGYGGYGYGDGGSAYGYGAGGYGYGSETGAGDGSTGDGGYIVVYTY